MDPPETTSHVESVTDELLEPVAVKSAAAST